MPAYSVVIPTFRGVGRLPIVLDSLERQSLPKKNFEIIVVSDGDTQQDIRQLTKIIERYDDLHIKLLHLPINLGPSAARNAGVKKAAGSIIFFTDDDCEVPALWIESHLSVYRDHPEVSAIGGWYRVPLKIMQRNIFDTVNMFRYESAFDLYCCLHSRDIPPYLRSRFAAKNTANLSVKAYVFASHQFDERLRAVEDVEFCTRIMYGGFTMYYIPQFVLHHKILNLRSFLRLAKSRGFGHHVNQSTTDLYTPRMNFAQRYMALKKAVALQIETSPELQRKKIAFKFLVYVYCIVAYSRFFKYIYAMQYTKHKKNLRLWKYTRSPITEVFPYI